ncbi:hypothetical protein AB0407_36300 [Streptomyces microflavus]|uniref:hypothetical protein n=1 Tax=Streptomyces microflavus TaxID=1919 RepID=UPI00344F5832
MDPVSPSVMVEVVARLASTSAANWFGRLTRLRRAASAAAKKLNADGALKMFAEVHAGTPSVIEHDANLNRAERVDRRGGFGCGVHFWGRLSDCTLQSTGNPLFSTDTHAGCSCERH